MASNTRAAIDTVLGHWADDEDGGLVDVIRVPARRARHAPLEPAPPEPLAGRLLGDGIDRFYRHQVEAIESVRSGRHTVVVAGTAAGKSLTYRVPIIETALGDPDATALLIFPTKALTQDQLQGIARLGGDEVVAATYDGDTEPEARRWVRKHANVVLTNPDMLHVGILPHHGGWARFLAGLRHVVIDELHSLRGVFGSHVAPVLRRLRRLARHYGADPTFVFTSATIGNPGELAAALVGADVHVIDADDAPAGAKTYALWNPRLEDPDTGARASTLGEATRVFTDLVSHDLHTIAFARSRKSSELIAKWARERLDPDRAHRVATYRGGYLASERRKLERRLFDGDLIGVAATNALELGIDVGGLDAAVVASFPGTIASFRQQTGRAGRTRDDALAVLVAGQDALDQYYMTHPDELFTREPEAVVVNPSNPAIMEGHLGCAAYELPLVPDDAAFFGPAFEDLLPEMVAAGKLLLRDGALSWRGGKSPAFGIDLRRAGGTVFTIADDRGRILGTIDEERAFSQCHDGAVYLHQGDTYVVERLDVRHGDVRVRRRNVGYYTQPKSDKDLRVVSVAATRPLGPWTVGHGRVEVESQVLGYQRRSTRTGEVLETVALDLPARRYETEAFWFEIPPETLRAADADGEDAPGVLHAVEHTAIAMLPRYAVCDRWDVGGISTPFHPDLRGPGFFIYDGYPGGAGIARLGYDVAERHLRVTLAALETCPCRAGCPSCVQSPKCGNFNEPLDKHGAIRLLRIVVAQLAAPARETA